MRIFTQGLLDFLEPFRVRRPKLLRNDVLSVYGVVCTEISEVVPINKGDQPDLMSELMRLCHVCAGRTGLAAHPAGITRLQALFRSLYQNSEPESKAPLPFPLDSPSSTVAGWFRFAILRYGPRAILGEGASDDEMAELAGFLDQQFRDCRDAEENARWNEDSRNWMTDEVLKQYRVKRAMSWDEACNTIFYTPDGYVGCGPRYVLPGDKVCLLDKCSLPVILRSQGSGWVNVGTCYVYGLSDGEPAGMVESGALKVDNFRIRCMPKVRFKRP
jgi:hypothetical protein